MGIEPIIFTIAEACAVLKCERTTLFELIRTGALKRAPKFGKSTCVYAESVFDALEVPRVEQRRIGRTLR